MVRLLFGWLNCKLHNEHSYKIDYEYKCKFNNHNLNHIYYVCKFCGKQSEIKGEFKNSYYNYEV